MVADAPPLSRDVAGLAALLAASGVTHLVRPEVYEGIVPHSLGHRRELVYVSGVAELVCARRVARAADPPRGRLGLGRCSSSRSSRRTCR